MSGGLIFVIIDDDKVIRRIIADFVRQMVRDEEITERVSVFDAASGDEALDLFEILFNTPEGERATYRDDPITPMPGRQAKTIVICDLEMEPMGGIELLETCLEDEALRSMNFVMMAQKPDLGLVSELGELGVMNILVKPITLEKFSHRIRNLAVRLHSDEYTLYKEAERLLDLREYAAAINLIKHAETRYTSMKWTILRGRAHLGLNEIQDAENDFEQAETGAHIASVIALKHMVKVYETAGDTKKTIDSLNKLTLKSPNNVDRRLKLAELFIKDNRRDAAKAVLDSLQKERRLDAEIKTKAADLLDKAGFSSDAASMRVQMVDGKLDDFVFCNNVAIGLRKLSRYEEADEIYQKILSNHSKEAVLWFNRAVNLAAWGRERNDVFMLKEAMDHFRTALKLSPDFNDANRAIQQLKLDIWSRMTDNERNESPYIRPAVAGPALQRG